MVARLPRGRTRLLAPSTRQKSRSSTRSPCRQAIKQREIDYPVAVDNDYAIWQRLRQRVLAGAVLRRCRWGWSPTSTSAKDAYEQSERTIQRLLGVQRELASVEGPRRRGRPPTGTTCKRPRRYPGYGRSERFAPADGAGVTPNAYELPNATAGYLMAWRIWTVGSKTVAPTSPGSIATRFHARDAHLVLSPGEDEAIPFLVLLDGEAPGRSAGVDVDEEGNGVLRDGRLTSSRVSVTASASALSSPSRARRRGYAFTFG